MRNIAVESGESWAQLVHGHEVPDHEIMRVMTYLGATGPDYLVHTPWYGSLSDNPEENDAAERLLLVGRDGAGRRLRRRGFEATAQELANDIDSIYLCRAELPDGAELRYIFIDVQPPGDDSARPLLLCHRDSFAAVHAQLKMGGRGGVVWRGGRVEDPCAFTEFDEDEFHFGGDLVERLLRETVDFLTGSVAQTLRTWDVPPKRSVLLHGDPGNGKTVLTRIAAKRALDVGLNVVIMEGRRRSSFSFERDIYGLGDELRQAAARGPAIIVLDDIDLHCGRRASDEGAEPTSPDEVNRPLSEMLDFLQGIVPTEGYALIATTNYLDRLDPALTRPGRIDVMLEVPNPSTTERQRALGRLIQKGPTPVPDVRAAVDLLGGASYADIAEVARRYKITAAHGMSGPAAEVLEDSAKDFASDRDLSAVQRVSIQTPTD